jgi:lysophospholipase L1-like esterase
MALKPSTARRLAVLAASAVAVGATLVSTVPSAAAAPAGPRPVFPGARYLALGDSVPFGFRESNTQPTPDYSKPGSFSGYPEMVARALKLDLTNAACPGETSSSMINVNAQSNGCETQADGSPGYTAGYPLHASYAHSQLRFAVGFLKTHPNTRLVSLQIGANDGFICLHDPTCAQTGIPAVLDTIQKNVTTILNAIRNNAHYSGQIVIMNYYSLDYSNTQQDQLSEALNQVVDNAARPFKVRFAGGYSAFKRAAEAVGNVANNTCLAGLLTVENGNTSTCGIHPSQAGHALLANVLEQKVVQS